MVYVNTVQCTFLVLYTVEYLPNLCTVVCIVSRQNSVLYFELCTEGTGYDTDIFDVWIMGETKALLSGLIVGYKEYIYMILDD